MSIVVAEFHNGVCLPAVGLGTYKLDDKTEGSDAAIRTALETGYRALDTADFYDNEPFIARLITDFGSKKIGEVPKPPVKVPATLKAVTEAEFLDGFKVPHGKPKDERRVFVTSKVWPTNYEPTKLKAYVNRHLKLFNREFQDLMLLHWPGVHTSFGTEEQMKDPKNLEVRLSAWHALEELYAEGKLRAIGVSNFMPAHLKTLLADIAERKAKGDKKATVPMVNQIEVSPYVQPEVELTKICEENRIVISCSSVLGSRHHAAQMMSEEDLIRMAAKYNRSPSQLVLRWAIQKGYAAIPKSGHPDRVRKNFDIFDFELTDEEMQVMKTFNTGNRAYGNPYEIV